LAVSKTAQDVTTAFSWALSCPGELVVCVNCGEVPVFKALAENGEMMNFP
jgi:hypothetical protein